MNIKKLIFDFLNETTAETKAKIADGTYLLTNLN